MNHLNVNAVIQVNPLPPKKNQQNINKQKQKQTKSN